MNLRLPRFGFNTLIDLLIVAYLIYKVMKWIEQTRAWTLFKGILLLAVVYIISEMLKLYTIRWIVSNTISVGLIAIIIIFQPEIRKALEQIGTGKLFLKFAGDTGNENSAEKSIGEIIAAAKKMSKERTGALIVIENMVRLGDLETTGVTLDAIVTNQLILSIFEDKMPLHDGAIIVRKNRIAAAGCILPLTQKEIGAELGTRHRAAVGVSEVSDADVLVVSNETGHISIAAGGRIYLNLNDEEIRNMLTHNKKPPLRKRQNFLKKSAKGR